MNFWHGCGSGRAVFLPEKAEIRPYTRKFIKSLLFFFFFLRINLFFHMLRYSMRN